MITSPTPPEQRFDLARARLLQPHGVDAEMLANILGTLGSGIDFSDIYFESTTRETWRLENERVSSGSYSVHEGVGIRTVTGDRATLAYSSDLKPSSLSATAEAARALRANGRDGQRVNAGPRLRLEGEGHSLYAPADVVDSADADAKIALLDMIERRVRAIDPRLVKISAGLALTHSIVLVAATDGTLAADVRPMLQLTLSVLAQSGDKRSQGSAACGGRYGIGDLPEATLERFIARAARVALVNLDARPAPAGVLPVVLGPGFPGVLLHEAVGHGLEGDAHRNRSSVFVRHMGERIAAPGVTVIDDATIPDRPGSLNIDDEGRPGERTVLIEDGRLVGLMQDGMNARLMNQSSTANARRASYSSLPMPRMTNTFLAPGTHDPAEIIASVKNGIYAPEFGGGSVDITSGRFNFSAVEAYLIEDGRITAPVAGATLIGIGHEALKTISMIGDDCRLDDGEAMCGKLGQDVRVGVGQPTIRLDEMVVGGAA